MRRLAILSAVLLATITPAQTLLHEWDFADGLGEWMTAHSAEALVVEDGAMVIRVSGPDPYIHCSEGHCLDLEANARQFIRIRINSSMESSGSFYYADSTEGRDAGFVAGQSVGFSVPSADEWHELDVCPAWDGHITRLRLDPPGNEAGPTHRVSRIAIYEWPASAQTDDIRDLTIDHGDWTPRGMASFTPGPGGSVLAGADPIIGTVLDSDPSADPWLTLEATTDGTGVATASWTDADERAHSQSIPFTPERSRYAIRFADVGPPPAVGTDVRMRFFFTDETGSVTIKQAAIADRPIGPPTLDLISAQLGQAFAVVGDPVALEITVQNSGGESLPAGVVPLSPAQGAELRHAPLAPGERATLKLAFDPATPGTHRLRVGPPASALELVLSASLPPSAAAKPGARVTQTTASLVGESIRLRAGSVGNGRYGHLAMEIREGDQWRKVAALPAIGQMIAAPPSRILLDAPKARATGQALTFTQAIRDSAGRKWTASATYRLAADDRIAVEHSIVSDQDAELHHFSGPWLRVGDGTSGADKHAALFPGIEYLGSDVGETEASSSARDIWPPKDLRIVPDRNWITMPLQAVALPNGDLVALLWANDSDGMGPAAVFASPNFVEGGDPRLPGAPLRSGANHLLGVFLPACPDQTDENSLVAADPIALAKGERLTIRTQIISRPNAQVLDAVDEWIAINEPAPAGKVAALREQTLRISGDFYLEEYGRKQQDAAGVAVQCLHLAHLLEDIQLREIAESAPAPATGVTHALHFGNVIDGLWAAGDAGEQALQARDDDGRWTFRPDARRSELGPAGDTNVGIIAPHVVSVLAAARATADEALLAEGLKGIEQMREYHVPRGAQVWEVPLHCPDILASGRAVDAFTLAYQLTGDETYLADAQYWARTALPFIYHWQHPREDLAPMRGGSIPVFGASGFTNSWFGRLVQWNGLAVARSLHALALAGGGEEWSRVAEDLVVSGQRQQITDTENADYGRYPDYWNMRTGIPGYWLSPGLLLTTVLERSGYAPSGDWLAIRDGAEVMTIGSPTQLVDPAVNGEAIGHGANEVDGVFDLTFTADYPLGSSSYVAIVGVAMATDVEIGGKPAEKSDDLSALASGWRYSDDIAAAILKLDHAAGARVPVRISGLEAASPVVMPDRRSWDFREGIRGWGTGPHDVRVERRDGMLVATATGPDPYFAGPLVTVPTDEVSRIVIRARVSQEGGFSVFWALGDLGFSQDRLAGTNAIPADGQFHDAVVDPSSHAQWRDTIRRVRLDPPGDAGAITEIESIRLEP